MHTAAMAWLVGQTSAFKPLTVVEFGARNINGSVRPLFPVADYLGVDVAAGAGVDVVCDACDWQPPSPVDCVVTAETLEHVDRQAEFVASALRALKPGGVLLVTCATDPRCPHSAGDGGTLTEGEHYRNVPPDDLAGWLAECEDVHIEVHTDRGDLYCRAVKGPAT